MKRLITLCYVSLLIANVFCTSAFAAETYSKTIRPIGNGYGATLIAATTPAHPNTGYYSRLGSTGAISRAKVLGSNLWKVFGAQADFEYATGTAADGSYYTLPYNCPANGIVGFYFTFNPSNPDYLTVTRQLIATNDYQNAQANWISDLGIGGVSEMASSLSELTISLQ